MPLDYTDDDLGAAPIASARVADVATVSPEHALIGLDGKSFVPPAVGMRSPEETRAATQQAQQQSVIRSSPPVATWASTAEPAHVAATQDDFPALAKVGSFLSVMRGQGALHDIASAAGASWQALQQHVQQVPENPFEGIGGAAFDVFGILGSPFAAVLSPAARGVAASNIPLHDVYLWGPNTTPGLFGPTPGLGPRLTDPDARMARAEFQVQTTAMLAMGVGNPRVGFATGMKVRPWEVREVAPEGQLRLTGPDGSVPPTAGAPPPGVHPAVDTIRSHIAEADVEYISRAQEEIAATKTHQRSPEVAEAYIKQQVGDQTVTIDPDALVRLGAEGHEPFPELAQEIVQATENGTELEVPLAKYLAVTSGQSYAEALNKATTFREGGTSVDEGKEKAAPIPVPEVVVDDELLSIAQKDSAASPFAHTFEEDAQGVIVGAPRALDVRDPLDEVAKGFEATRQHLREKYGNTVTLFRADAPAAEHSLRTQTLLYGDKALAEKFAVNGRTLTSRAVPVRDIVAVYARPSGYYEFVVKKGGTPPTEEGMTAEETQHFNTIAARATSAVEEVFQAQRLTELFRDPAAVGMTKPQFEAYNLHVENAIADTLERMHEKARLAVLRERKPEWQERIAQHAAQVEVELAQNPAITARAYLAQGKGPLGEPIETPFKLSKTDAIAQYGKDLGLPDRMFGANGISADEAASIFGFDSGAEMMRELRSLQEAQGELTISQHMKAMARQIATERTRAELGFDLTDEAIRAAASELVNGPAITNFLAAELKQLAQLANLPFSENTVKAYAAMRFDNMLVKDALNLKKLEGYVYKGGIKAERALLKGDVPTAFLRKQQQYIHHLELQQAHKFAKTYARAGRNITKWARKRKMPGMAQPYLDRIQGALVEQTIPVKRQLAELARSFNGQGLEGWIEGKRTDGEDIVYAPTPAGLPPKQMTVDTFTAWNDMLTSIAVWGRKTMEIIADGKKMEAAAAVDEALVLSADIPNKPLDRNVGAWNSPTTPGRTLASKFDAAHRILESLFDFMDGNDTRGIHNRVLMDGATDAANRVDGLHREIYSPIIDQFKEIPGAIRKTYSTRIANNVLLDPRDGQPVVLRRGDLLPILANMGTEANRVKLAEGYGTTPDAVLNLLNDYITPEEGKFVQFIWDQLSDKLFPIADANARALRGYGLTKETALPVPLTTGSLKGGYFPLAYDHKFIPAPKRGEFDPENPTVQPFRTLTTPTGFEKDRTGYTGPIMLSLDRVLKDHLRDVFVRVGYGEYVASARRFILDKRIKSLWVNKLGAPYYNLLMPWLEAQVWDVARPKVDDAVVQGLARKLRQNMTTSVMGFSYSVGTAQVMGALPVMSEVGLGWALDGYRSFLFKATTGGLKEAIYDKSEEMASRHWNLEQNVRDAHEELSALDITASPMSQFMKGWKDLSLKYINAMDKYTVSGAAWLAGYRKAVYELRMSEGDAIRYADKIVRKTQGSGRPKDLPAVQRPNNEFARVLTFAYTWPGRMYNLQAEAIRDFTQGRFRSGSWKAFTLLLAIPIVQALHDGDHPGDHDDPADWFVWMLRKATLSNLGTSVYFRDIANIADRKLAGKQAGSPSTPFSRFVDSFTQVVKLDSKGVHLSKKNWVRAWGSLLGMAGMLPGGGQWGKTGQFLADVHDRKQRPKNPLDWYEGLTSGKIKTEN